MPADFGPRLPPEGVEGLLVVSLSPSHLPHCVEANACRRFSDMVLAVKWNQLEDRGQAEHCLRGCTTDLDSMLVQQAGPGCRRPGP